MVQISAIFILFFKGADGRGRSQARFVRTA
jgi:hypothetical protein